MIPIDIAKTIYRESRDGVRTLETCPSAKCDGAAVGSPVDNAVDKSDDKTDGDSLGNPVASPVGS